MIYCESVSDVRVARLRNVPGSKTRDASADGSDRGRNEGRCNDEKRGSKHAHFVILGDVECC
jgi:hypothetical protein